MEFFVKLDPKNQSVVAEASGMINTNVAKEMVLAVGLEINNSGFQRCFFDLFKTELDPSQTMTEMYFFVNAFKLAGISKSIKMAALYSTGGEHRQQLEKAMRHEGFTLKHFTDKNKALHWLYQ
jgi:hypothetical protein